MTGDQPTPGLFWLAGSCVLIVLLWVAGRLFLGPPSRRKPTLWVAALACLMPACSVAQPLPSLSAPVGSAGWSSPHMPIDHYPPTGRGELQRI